MNCYDLHNPSLFGNETPGQAGCDGNVIAGKDRQSEMPDQPPVEPGVMGLPVKPAMTGLTSHKNRAALHQ